MRYRPLSPLGDMTLGVPFYTNNVQAVAQAIGTRLKLWLAEWFMDITDGTPYYTQVLGERYNKNYDAAIKQRILGTPGVQKLVSYSSQFNSQIRTLTINAAVQTIYSTTPLQFSDTLAITPGVAAQ